MAIAKNTLTFTQDELKRLLIGCIDRATEYLERDDKSTIARYPLVWMYRVISRKDWDVIEKETATYFIRYSTKQEKKQFMEWVKDPHGPLEAKAMQAVNELFSKHLFCQLFGIRSMRRHKWTSVETALTCPEQIAPVEDADQIMAELDASIEHLDPEREKKTLFQRQLDASIAYLDLDHTV